MSVPPPTRRRERELSAGGSLLVAGMDEVGRGCLAGPVSVGVVISHHERRPPVGLRDSKLLTPEHRERLVAPILRWSVGCAVGHASAAEIDAVGIIAALRLAGRRAVAALVGAGIRPDVVLLDGNHDWLSDPPTLFELTAPQSGPIGLGDQGEGLGEASHAVVPRVTTRIKADMTCTGVAAASILAKVERDAMMRAEHARDPRYDWRENKGYASPSHIAALAAHGPSELHRRSWNLPGASRLPVQDGMMVS